MGTGILTSVKSIDASGLDHIKINEAIRNSKGDIEIKACLGQRFIGAGLGERRIRLEGVPGNALGAYLNGATLEVLGNAQDAVGDTMNAGEIIVHGNIGDTAGYAMRGGSIYVRGNAGYRAGIHMKEYKEHVPVIVIGGRAGSFLGEYQAGGIIIVLGLNKDGRPAVSNFPCTGMHGGRLFLRKGCRIAELPGQVNVHSAKDAEIAEISRYIKRYCDLFGAGYDDIVDPGFSVVVPNSANPYRQLYVAN